MLTERRDYLLRLIQQAGAAARRLRELLSNDGADVDGVVSKADSEIGALLGGGAQAQLLERVDADTAARLVGDAERVRLWVALLDVQAEALNRLGRSEHGRRVQERSAALAKAVDRLAK